MHESPLVSIVMPAYNAASTIEQSIQSVLNQTWQQWELLIVADAPTDNTVAIAQKWSAQDTRITVLPNASNMGVAASRNRALQHAQGAYIAFLDSDDLWLPNKLETQIAFMQQEDVGLSYSTYLRFNEKGPINVVIPPAQVDYDTLLKSNVIPNLTSMVRSDLLADLSFKRIGHEDFLFWLSVLKRTRHAYRVPHEGPLAHYRVHEQSLSSNKSRNLKWQWHIYRHELGLPPWRSAYFMGNYAIRALLKRIPLQNNAS